MHTHGKEKYKRGFLRVLIERLCLFKRWQYILLQTDGTRFVLLFFFFSIKPCWHEAYSRDVKAIYEQLQMNILCSTRLFPPVTDKQRFLWVFQGSPNFSWWQDIKSPVTCPLFLSGVLTGFRSHGLVLLLTDWQLLPLPCRQPQEHTSLASDCQNSPPFTGPLPLWCLCICFLVNILFPFAS